MLARKNILQNINALLVGKPYDEVYYKQYKSTLVEISTKFKLPIVYNINFGHALPRAMLAYGVNTQIDFDRKTIKITEKIFKG